MQNQTNKYQRGKIYEIVCNTTGKKYVGSTINAKLCHRLSDHVSAYRRYLNGKLKSKYTSFNVLEGGNYKIYLLERCPCESKEELLKKEREYIERLDCVNKNLPGRSQKEYKKGYYEANKEKLIEYQKEYQKEHYTANREKIIESQKGYYENNKEKLIEYQKEYQKEIYQKNKQKINERASEKTKCACGAEVRRDWLTRHQKSKKHLEKTIQFNDDSD